VGVRCWLSQRPPDVRRNAVAAEADVVSLIWCGDRGARTGVASNRAVTPFDTHTHAPRCAPSGMAAAAEGDVSGKDRRRAPVHDTLHTAWDRALGGAR